MLQNYFKTAWRNFRQFKVFSFINIGGLAIGLASCLALLLYVAYEWGYDRQFDHYSNIYRVYENQRGGDAIYSLPVTPAVLAGTVVQEIPGVVRAVRFVDMEPRLLSHGDHRFLRSGLYADSSFFAMLNYRFVEGSRAGALANAHSIVLTRTLASALFGSEDPMGKTILYNKGQALQVSGVIENLPANETLSFDYILPWSLNEEENSWLREAGWGSNNCYTLVELKDAASYGHTDALFRRLVKTHFPAGNAEAFLHPMSAWHLYSKFENGKVVGGAIEQVRLFAILAIGILLIACINFMNLSTARSQKRAREVGIRKTIGSSRGDLIRQFFMESFFFSLLASVLALVLLEGGLPFLNRWLDTDLHVPYHSRVFWAGFASLVFVTGLLAGSYPALYLSSFQPIKVLKGWARTGKDALRFRQTLVVFQFTLALFLVIAVAVIYLQINYIRNKPIGYAPDNLVEVPLQGSMAGHTEVLEHELLRSGVAESVTPLSKSLTNIWSNGWNVSWPGKPANEKDLFYFLGMGYGFSATTGIVIAEGRDFAKDRLSDSSGVLINETAARLMGFAQPVGSRIRTDNQELTIIGVFKDFVLGSPFMKAPPVLAYLNPGQGGFLSIRLAHGHGVAASVASISSILKRMDPEYPPIVHFVDQDFALNYYSQQRVGALASIFGSLAVLISCMGLFGLATFAAEQRVKEIGIRKVMGASVLKITSMLSADFLKLVALAALIAFPLGWMGMHQWLQQFDYRVGIGWTIFAAAGMSAALIVLATVSVQAVKAAMANPVRSLRSE